MDNPFLEKQAIRVAVAQGQGPYHNTLTALKSVPLQSVRGKRVLLKPNAGRVAHSGEGITTHAEVIAAAIDAFRQAGADVAVGESPITGTAGAQWMNQDIGIVNNAAEPLYVAISNAAGAPAVVYHDDANAATIDTWTEWIIHLKAFADQGVVLTDVDKIAIGMGTKGNMTVPGGSGKMYFDDIRVRR